MYLFLATDDGKKKENKWFVGASKSSPDKIKEDLSLDKKTANVDLVVESSEAKEIICFLKQYIDHTDVDKKNVFLVEGTHGQLANLLNQMTKDYECEYPSIRRSISRWFKSIDS